MQRQRQLCEVLGIELPIVQAPMAGAHDQELAVAVANAGGLGSLPCALLSPEQIRQQVETFRARSKGPLNLNFFCHAAPLADPVRERAWLLRLQPYYVELGLDTTAGAAPVRAPFDETFCTLVEELCPQVVSFHFGLPAPGLLARVRATGAKVFSSATTVAEARWLEEHGCDVIIAQGAEGGGHRGMFLSDSVAAQVGTMALVPQVVDAVRLPVLAAGGIGDARAIAAALALGASGVQLGTAYLRAQESRVSPLHRAALAAAGDDSTRITNVFTGRPARAIANRAVQELGPMAADAPAFPGAVGAMVPLRTQAEKLGRSEFSPMWAGQAASLAREGAADDLTRALWTETLERLAALAR